MNTQVKLKFNFDKIEQKQSIQEILEKLQGQIILEFDAQKQNALIQYQNFMIEQHNIFQLNDQNQLQQDPLYNQLHYNEVIGIPNIIKFIAIHNLLQNHFQQKAYLQQMKIFPDWNLGEYKAKKQLNQSQQNLLNQINQQIKSIVVYSVFCTNYVEKRQKIIFLQKSLYEIAKILETNQENILIGEIKEPHEQVGYLKKLIFILHLNENLQQLNLQSQIQKKQILMNKFITENFNIHTLVIIVKKPKCTRIELKEIVQELKQQYQNINIKVGYNRFDISNFEKLVYLEIEQYDDYYNFDQFLQQEIQDRASKILRLNIQDKLNFENYILKLPMITNSNIKFKHCKSGIKLSNPINQVNQFRVQVNTYLKEIKNSLLYIKFNQKFQAFFDLIGMDQKKQILTKLFMNVTQQQYMLSIIDIKQNTIDVLVYFNRVLNNDIIALEKILNETMAKLHIADLEKYQFDQLELTIDQFQQKFFSLVIVENQKLTCILHLKQYNEILKHLDSLKTLSILSYQPKSKLHAQQILQDYQNKLIEQSQEILSIKLSQNNENIYLECQTKNMAILEIFQKYEKVLDQQLMEIPIDITKMEAKFLHRNCQQEIQKECNEQIFELLFDFNEYQTPTDSGELKQSLKKSDVENQFIKFLMKKVYFDTNFKCEVFMKFSNKNNQDRIVCQKEDKINPNVISIKDYFSYYQKQKVPFKQLGVIYEEVKDIFPKLLQLFMSKEQNKFYELVIFIDNQKFKLQYEQELLYGLGVSIQESYQDYQWQWSDGRQFNDYDDSMINQQIETAYQAFILDNQKNELILRFPYSYQPGTHSIDLNKGTILDHANGTVKQLKQKDGLYYVGSEQADDILNQYINEKNQLKKYQFTVFLKKYIILFKSKEEIYQINFDTKYKRKLRRAVKTDKYFQFIHDYIKSKQNEVTPSETPNGDNQIYCRAKTFIKINQELEQIKQNQIEKIKKIIQKILEKYITNFEIILPVTNDQIYFSFLNFLNNNTLQIEGEFNQNQSISIKSFEKSQQLIIEVVEFLQNIPQNWNPSSYQNLYYFDVLQPDLEEVKSAFPFLDIKSIQLVQNYDQWAKYQYIKDQLENQNETLLLFGNKKDCAQEEMARVTLSLSLDYHTGPYVKCGKTIGYVKDNYCESQKGQKEIIVLQVLLGKPQELKQQYIISDYSDNNYQEGDYYFIKRNRIYPKFIITLNEQ
ncbi:unnamed protein product [Paramecium sonneborni]|uniref:Uncharacterized protein n=1 Tax=Paramecium sonneborni TaxID=65129 RepID=A0A8S1QTD1_9CILI|nr:unnamed protein product [Paramecium sonneborni]